jgi:hypothetical protein
VSIRTFSLDDPAACEAICRRRAPADRNPRGAAPVKVMSMMDSPFERDSEAEAQTALMEWQWHVDNGRIGGQESR